MSRSITLKIIFLVFIFAIIGWLGTGVAQEATPTPTLLAQPAELTVFFPDNLFCEDLDSENNGISWQGILIGDLSVEDLLDVINQLEVYNIVIDEQEIIFFYDNIEQAISSNLPLSGNACFQDDEIKALQLSYIPSSKLSLDTFIVSYDVPDWVTWLYGDPRQRLMIWLEYGIAIAVYTDVEIDNINVHGFVSSIIYFVPSEDFEMAEDQYPYNRTWFPDTPELEDIYGEQNPFDFDAMIATITAEPSRTPTPTFTPRATVTESPSATPTPIIFPPPRFGQPELICPYFSNVQPGYSWHNVTIGVSSQQDLENVLEQFGQYEIILPDEGTLANSIRYQWMESNERGQLQQAPFSIDVCFQDTKVMVLDITTMFQSPMYINDLVAFLGEPDVVTWSSVENNRAVFWFSNGVMASVFVQRGDTASFGQIGSTIYFPPQSSDGYEDRWPFSVTRVEPFIPADPSIPSEQNPFDFDAMIATITAEPSRTPTPTFTPRATTTENPSATSMP